MRQLIVSPDIALAISVPSQAVACRVGHDIQLFVERPPKDALPGAEIIRVHFSNAQPRRDDWPKDDGQFLGKRYVGVARLIDSQPTNNEACPVYAFVSSCRVFWGSAVSNSDRNIEGSYYLIGRFHTDGGARRFYAGGLRSHSGRPI